MSTLLESLSHPICLLQPERLRLSGWIEHIPFAYYLTQIARPRILVELGTHHGVSYCAFCQGAQYAQLDASFYAVDTWKGDEHAGFYGPEVFHDLRAYHDARYGSFSQLLRMSFDDALSYFADASIDILHIDGYHSYEDTKHHYDAWLPKLSEQGIILFHDINVHENQFGVWKLWETLKTEYPSFTFGHGYGLGLLAVGTQFPGDTQLLFESTLDEQLRVRSFFAFAGRRWRSLYEHQQETQNIREQLAKEQHATTEREKHLAEYQQQLQQLEQTITARNEQLAEQSQTLSTQQAQYQQSLAEGQAQIQQLQQAIKERDARLAQQAQSHTDQQAERQNLEDNLRELLAQSEQSLAERIWQVQQLQQALESQSQSLAADTVYHEQLQAELHAAQQQITSTSSEFEKRQQQSQRMEQQLKRVQRQYQQQNKQIQEKNQQLRRDEQHLKQLQSQLKQHQSQITHLQLATAREAAFNTSRLLRGLLHMKIQWKYMVLRLRQRIGGLQPSPLFDSRWYLEQYPDAAATGQNPYLHYLIQGWLEGKNPSLLFDTNVYLSRYEDVLLSGINPLIHYLKHGWREGRDAHPLFDTDWYLQQNPDIAKAGIEPFTHYLERGWREGRNPHPTFSTAKYLEANPDVAARGVNPLYHYVRYGQREGRALAKTTSVNRPEPSAKISLIPTIRIDKHPYEYESPVSVIIPIYNAYDAVVRCLASVFEYTVGDVQLILIDDASDDERISALLESYQAHQCIRVITHAVNQGYTATINEGIEFAAGRDVILLNSDTEVGPRWVQNLLYAAYRSPHIGTVTAVSNNAGAFSVPEPDKENTIPTAFIAEDFMRLLLQSTQRIQPKLPTGNGFCMLIKRSLIDQIGLFDVAAFPFGYGEENDFCMRAFRQGWLNVLDESTYVLHVQSASFQERKSQYLEQGLAVIRQRYPEYAALVRQSFAADTMRSIQQRIRELSRKTDIGSVKPRILYVISTQTGGTPLMSYDLMLAIQPAYTPFLLHCDSQKISLSTLKDDEETCFFTYDLTEPITQETHLSHEYDQVIDSLLCQLGIEILHIHHIAWHSLNLPRIAQQRAIPVIFSFHDFYTVDPSIHLLNNDQQFSQTHFLQPQGEQFNPLWGNALVKTPQWSSYWRERMEAMLQACSVYITTVQSAKDILTTAFPFLHERRFYLIPHGRDMDTVFAIDRDYLPQPDAPLKILVPGNIGYHKGYDLIADIKQLDTDNDLEFHFVGKTVAETTPAVYHGAYERQDFPRFIEAIRPHIVGIFSIWPETYLHTLTEGLACGLPAVVTNLGAQAERIQQDGGGWILESLDAAVIYEFLLTLRKNTDDYLAKLDEVANWQRTYLPQHTTAIMAERYCEIYRLTQEQQRTSHATGIKIPNSY